MPVRSLVFTLKARVRIPSDNNRVEELSVSRTIEIEPKNEEVYMPYLRKDEEGYYLQLLGMNGKCIVFGDAKMKIIFFP